MKHLAALLLPALLACSTTFAQDAASSKSDADPNASDESKAEASPLDQLNWMVGRWVDQGEESTITTECSWTKNHKFLTRSFSISIDGDVSLEGTQVIGWDAAEERVRSWTFDSEGGFGEGHWMKDGNRWLVKTSYVLASGDRASAVNVITYIDENTLHWQSIAREVGGELLPNIPVVTVVREKADEDKSQDDKQEASQ